VASLAASKTVRVSLIWVILVSYGLVNSCSVFVGGLVWLGVRAPRLGVPLEVSCFGVFMRIAVGVRGRRLGVPFSGGVCECSLSVESWICLVQGLVLDLEGVWWSLSRRRIVCADIKSYACKEWAHFLLRHVLGHLVACFSWAVRPRGRARAPGCVVYAMCSDFWFFVFATFCRVNSCFRFFVLRFGVRGFAELLASQAESLRCLVVLGFCSRQARGLVE
jgi:hypothetical protein